MSLYALQILNSPYSIGTLLFASNVAVGFMLHSVFAKKVQNAKTMTGLVLLSLILAQGALIAHFHFEASSIVSWSLCSLSIASALASVAQKLREIKLKKEEEKNLVKNHSELFVSAQSKEEMKTILRQIPNLEKASIFEKVITQNHFIALEALVEEGFKVNDKIGSKTTLEIAFDKRKPNMIIALLLLGAEPLRRQKGLNCGSQDWEFTTDLALKTMGISEHWSWYLAAQLCQFFSEKDQTNFPNRVLVKNVHVFPHSENESILMNAFYARSGAFLLRKQFLADALEKFISTLGHLTSQERATLLQRALDTEDHQLISLLVYRS